MKEFHVSNRREDIALEDLKVFFRVVFLPTLFIYKEDGLINLHLNNIILKINLK